MLPYLYTKGTEGGVDPAGLSGPDRARSIYIPYFQNLRLIFFKKKSDQVSLINFLEKSIYKYDIF
jgi:hypothetical protein